MARISREAIVDNDSSSFSEEIELDEGLRFLVRRIVWNYEGWDSKLQICFTVIVLLSMYHIVFV